jgi:hypothetical protein
MRVFGTVSIAAVLFIATAGAVSAQAEPLFGPMAPARIAGGWVHTGDYREGQVEQLGELMYQVTGTVTTVDVTSDDARFNGTATATGDLIGHYPPALVAVVDTNWLIEDDAGAWMGSSRQLASMADDDPVNTAPHLILDGSGAYEGLTAYVIVDPEEETFVGAIVPDEMPELPPDWVEIYEASYKEEPANDG